jgi:hypothetical protein
VFEEFSIADILSLVAVVGTGVMLIAGAVVKFTKTKKDDEVFEKVKEVVDPIIDVVDGDGPPKA